MEYYEFCHAPHAYNNMENLEEEEMGRIYGTWSGMRLTNLKFFIYNNEMQNPHKI